MIWQRMLSRLSRRDQRSKTRRDKKNRRLTLESLHKRELLASDLGAISGTAFIDADGDGVVDVGETLLQNVDVTLYLDDVTQNGVFDAGETQVGTFTTGADGQYRFTSLDGNDVDVPPAPINQTDDGFYVLTFAAGVGGVQDEVGDPVNGVVLSDDVGVQVTDDTGTTAITIDNFQFAQPGQPITESNQTADPLADRTTNSSSGALGSGGGVVGDERDVQIIITTGTGDSSVFRVDTTPGNEFFTIQNGNVTATTLVQYDGIDNDAAGITRDVTGLGGIDLTDGDSEAGLLFAVQGDQNATGGFEVRVFDVNGNSGVFSQDLVANTLHEIFVAFDDFTLTGAMDFTNVGAIEVFIDGVNSNGGAGAANIDVTVSVLESQKSTEYPTVAPATVPLTLGGEVFVDNGGGADQAEQNNGLQDGGEPVFLAAAGNEIQVELYNVDPTGGGNPPPIATTTVDIGTDPSPGSYEFTQVDLGAGNVDLGPGTYFVVIPESEFTAGGPLVGFIGSQVETPGNGGVDVTDDNADNDNDGTFVAGIGFVSGAITLAIGEEPTGGNTNTTVDFGVLPATDLRIDKTLDVGSSNLVVGGNASFNIQINNLGDSEATNITVTEVVPDGLTLVDIRDNTNSVVATTTNGNEVSFTFASLAAGGTAVFTVNTTIDNDVVADPLNEIRVAGYEVEDDIDTVDADRSQGDPVQGALENNTAVELVDVPLADLTITKTDGETDVSAGNTLTYTIVVSNISDDDAADVVVLDTLPTGVTFDPGVANAFTSTDGTDTVEIVVGGADDGKVRITAGALAGNSQVTFTLLVSVDPDIADGSSPLDNAVTASASNAPDVSSNDQTNVARETDVTVAKTVVSTRTPDDRTDGDDGDDIIDNTSPFQPVAGGFVTYQITATNAGPSTARGVEVTDTLNAGLTLVAGSFDAGTSGATITQNGQDLTFTVPDLAPGESRSFTFEVEIGSNQTAVIPNDVTISTTDPESNDTNNTASVSIDPDPRIDLILDKQVSSNTAVPGDTATPLVYTFTVSHDVDSLSDAVNVDVTDTLPAGLTGVVLDAPGATSQDFNTTTRQILVEYASIPVGTTRVFTVTATVNADATADIVNTASVTVPGVTELDTANNSDAVTVTLDPEFDITIDKSIQGNTTVGPLDNVTYTIVVSHDLNDDGSEADNGESPSRATGIVVTDTLPDGLTFVSATSGGAAVTPTSTTNGVIVLPEFDLDSGSTRTITITASVDDDSSGVLNNVSTVTTDAGETQTDNNSDNVDLTVVPQANVRVSKAVDNTTAQTGTELTYTVTVFNDGPSPAEAVTAVDTLPAGLTFVSGTGPSGALTANGQVVTVNGGTIASGSSFQFTIVAQVNAGVTADQINTVSVSTTTTETNANDNTASATTAIDQAINELSGTIFRDFDDDGVQDGSDSALEGIEVLLTGGDLPAAGLRTTTDENGFYQFEDLIAGDYQVQRLDTPRFNLDGKEQAGTGSTPADSGMTIDVIVGANNDTSSPDNNFALVPYLSYKLCIL